MRGQFSQGISAGEAGMLLQMVSSEGHQLGITHHVEFYDLIYSFCLFFFFFFFIMRELGPHAFGVCLSDNIGLSRLPESETKKR